MTVLSRRSKSRKLRGRGSDGLRRLCRWVAQAGSDPKSDNTVRVMASNRKTILETVPDIRGNIRCSSLQQTFRIATQTAIGRTGGVHTSVLAVNEHSLCGDPFLCAVSQLIPQWMLTFSWVVVELSASCARRRCSLFSL